MSVSSEIRLPQVAGTFYPAHRAELDNLLSDLLRDIPKQRFNGNLLALIAPHAGYQYSGLTAAFAYKLMDGLSFNTVVIVSPSHREYFNGISIYPGEAYQTPLGMLPIDDEMRNEMLSGETSLSLSTQGHGSEHALEVQLPFIQKMIGSVKILPIIMGDQRPEHCRSLGIKLANVLNGKSVLMVASSDLSHYYPEDIAQRLDRVVINDLLALDPKRLMDDLADNRTQACGGGPVASVLIAGIALGGNKIKILDYRNSGDVTGDRSNVVGYLSAAIFRGN